MSRSHAFACDCGEARKAPAVAVQPAGFVLRVSIAAQGAYASTLIAAQRSGEFAADYGIARSREIHEENRALERGRERVCAGAREVCHGSDVYKRQVFTAMGW